MSHHSWHGACGGGARCAVTGLGMGSACSWTSGHGPCTWVRNPDRDRDQTDICIRQGRSVSPRVTNLKPSRRPWGASQGVSLQMPHRSPTDHKGTTTDALNPVPGCGCDCPPCVAPSNAFTCATLRSCPCCPERVPLEGRAHCAIHHHLLSYRDIRPYLPY